MIMNAARLSKRSAAPPATAAGDVRRATGAILGGIVVAVGIATTVAAAGLQASPEPLRSIGEILALTDEGPAAEQPVIVRGVVTVVSPHVVIQDGDDAIYVEPAEQPGDAKRRMWKRPLGVPLEVGEDIEVTGAVDFKGFRPRLVMHAIRRLGTRPLPEPAAIDFTRFFAGGDDGRRVRVAGVVQAVLDNPEGWSLIFESASRRMRVIVSQEVRSTRPDEWIDADVDVVGVCYSYRNSRGEFLAPSVFVGRAEDLRVVRAPAQAAFELPVTPLGRIARFRLQPLGGHRLRTSGVVSFAAPGMLYLQEGVGGVRVELAPGSGSEAGFRAGDRVEVAGFPDVRSGIGAISWAVARKISDGTVPRPERIQPSEIIRLNEASTEASEVARPGSYDGCLICCRGRIEAVNRSAAGTVVTLIEQGTAFSATLLEPGAADAMTLLPGTEVEVTGIVKALRKGPGEGEILRGSLWLAQIELLLRSAADIRVLRMPPWWTPARLAAAAVAAGALAVAAVVWVTTLRREVVRQTARALEEESARFKAGLDYEITIRERNRLAANLHDTILQTVTGIGFQLQACQAEETSTGRAKPARLEVARRMVSHAVEQLRGTVWALHTPSVGDKSLATALEERLARLQEGFETPVRVRFANRERPLSDTVAANLILVAQEAVTNALKHAGGTAIDVSIAFDEDTVTLCVRDDGRGFDVDRRPGPSEGHFGIDGMIDRMLAFGGTCSLQSTPRRGTTVTAVAPIPVVEDHLSDRTDGETANHGSMAG
jgi:signal transduction histidine kinase